MIRLSVITCVIYMQQYLAHRRRDINWSREPFELSPALGDSADGTEEVESYARFSDGKN
jgi:hypothetical protein